MKIHGSVLISLPACVGLAFGILVLHPTAMLFQCTAGGAWADRLDRAFVGSFDPGMGTMAALFAVLGACLAVLSQAARPAPATATRARAPRATLRRLCMYCKAMPQGGADGADHWLPFEQVLYHSQGMEFSHGVCPRCKAQFLDPQVAALKKGKDPTPQEKATRGTGGVNSGAAPGDRGE